MKTSPAFTDEDLTAFLDGEATPDQAERIKRALAQDQLLRPKLERLSIDTAMLKACFDSWLEDPAATRPLLVAAAPQIHTASLRAVAAAAVICLLVGFGGSALVGRQGNETWQDLAAAYHALYVSATLARVDRSLRDTAAELARVSSAIGKTIDLSALAHPQLDYKRAQILGFEGRPLLQLAFLTPAGVPVALCIVRTDGTPGQGVRVAALRGMSAASWSREGYEFLLIGGADDALIRSASMALAGRI